MYKSRISLSFIPYITHQRFVLCLPLAIDTPRMPLEVSDLMMHENAIWFKLEYHFIPHSSWCA